MADMQKLRVRREKQILPGHTVACIYNVQPGVFPPQPQPGKASALKPCWLLAKSIVGRRHLACCTKRQLTADKLFKPFFIYISIQYDLGNPSPKTDTVTFPLELRYVLHK